MLDDVSGFGGQTSTANNAKAKSSKLLSRVNRYLYVTALEYHASYQDHIVFLLRTNGGALEDKKMKQ